MRRWKRDGLGRMRCRIGKGELFEGAGMWEGWEYRVGVLHMDPLDSVYHFDIRINIDNFPGLGLKNC